MSIHPQSSALPASGASPEASWFPSAADCGPLTICPETATNQISFNVMPDRSVTETLFIREYRIGKRYGEALFDRTYQSQMLKSPDHLIFLTALVHTQKLLYAVLCHEFGLPYDPYAPERLKIWPTRVDSSIPKLIRNGRGLLQKLWVRELKHVEGGKYELTLRSMVEETLVIESDCAVFLI